MSTSHPSSIIPPAHVSYSDFRARSWSSRRGSSPPSPPPRQEEVWQGVRQGLRRSRGPRRGPRRHHLGRTAGIGWDVGVDDAGELDQRLPVPTDAGKEFGGMLHSLRVVAFGCP